MALPGMKLSSLAQRILALARLSNPNQLANVTTEAAIWSICPDQTQEDFQRNIFQAEGWRAVGMSHSFLAE